MSGQLFHMNIHLLRNLFYILYNELFHPNSISGMYLKPLHIEIYR